LLSREAPSEYLEMWSRFLGQDKDSGPATGHPHVIFRVGYCWLALRASVLREITAPAVIRSLPHRRSELLLGLTAVRGEIYLCASLHLLIGEPQVEEPGVPRFLVIGHDAGRWIFPVDEVSRIEELPEDSIEPLPATLAHTGSVYTRGIAGTADRPVGVIDEDLIFRALERKIP
jgi:chemotaxis-related protein WspD